MTLEEFEKLNENDIAKYILIYGPNSLRLDIHGTEYVDFLTETQNLYPRVKYLAINKKASLELLNFDYMLCYEILTLFEVDNDGEFLTRVGLLSAVVVEEVTSQIVNHGHPSLSMIGFERLEKVATQALNYLSKHRHRDYFTIIESLKTSIIDIKHTTNPEVSKTLTK